MNVVAYTERRGGDPLAAPPTELNPVGEFQMINVGDFRMIIDNRHAIMDRPDERVRRTGHDRQRELWPIRLRIPAFIEACEQHQAAVCRMDPKGLPPLLGARSTRRSHPPGLRSGAARRPHESWNASQVFRPWR